MTPTAAPDPDAAFHAAFETFAAHAARRSPAERAIVEAMTQVERLVVGRKTGADPLLTEAVDLLSKARAKVVAYVAANQSPADYAG